MSDHRDVDDLAPRPSRARPELRLALAMRGGVSLAVWMGGACAEIDSLRRSSAPAADGREDPGVTFWRSLLEHSPYSRVVVDVMAGASAGGLNSVVFGTAVRHGFPMADLLGVWSEVAGVEELRRSGPPWISLFDGDRTFLDVIDERLHRLVAAAPSLPVGAVPAIDVQLTATLVEPLTQPATSPVDEPLRRPRSSAGFHFRHDPDAVFPRSDLEVSGLSRLAVAARSSASFPFAFEAAVVRSTRPPVFRSGPVGAEAATSPRLVDCRGTFSESRGGEGGRTDEIHHDDFVVADGGILDNIPIGRALDAIRRMPASGPTRRVLVYLHPTGPAQRAPVAAGSSPTSTVDRRGARALVGGLIASRLQGESIDADLEQMEEANRNLRLRRRARRAAAARTEGLDDPVAAARSEIESYREQRAAVDADAVRSLLRDPLAALGGDPFPVAPPGSTDDRWRSPLSLWSADDRLRLDEELRTTFRGRLEDRVQLGRLMTGGLGPLVRTVELLTDLALAAELGARSEADRAAIGSLKAELYRLGSLIRELERMRQIGWVVLAGRLVTTDDGRPSPGDASSRVSGWVVSSLDLLNGLLECERAEAAALCEPPPSAVRTGTEASLRAAFLDRCDRGLQRLVVAGPDQAGDLEEHREPLADPVDVREPVIAALGRISDALVDRWRRRAMEVAAVADDSQADLAAGADVIWRILEARTAGEPGAAVDHAELFAALEVLLVREHLLGPSAGVEVSFVRMSAAAPTIGARRFTRLHEVSTRLNREHTDADHLLPDVKLAGNELSNFGAFLDERWRANDWHWGRMDAVPSLVDLLLGLDRPEPQRPPEAALAELSALVGLDPTDVDVAELRRALIRHRQDQISAELVGAAGTERSAEDARAGWDVGLETLTVPGAAATATTMADLAQIGAVVACDAVGRPRFAGPVQAVGRYTARRLARPRGGSPGAVPEPRRRGVSRWWQHALVVVVALLVALVVWGLAEDPPSLLAGLAAGLVLGVGPGTFMLWLALVRRPAPAAGERLALFVLPIVAVAVVVAAVTAAVVG